MSVVGFAQEAAGRVSVTVDGQALPEDGVEISYEKEIQAVRVKVPAMGIGRRIQIFLPIEHRAKGNEVQKRVFEFLNQAEIEFTRKDEVFKAVKKEARVSVLLVGLHAMGLEKGLYEALAEILTAAAV